MQGKDLNKKDPNVLKGDDSTYGFSYKSEIEKLKEDVFRSSKEKFLLFTEMPRNNATIKKAAITQKL